MTMTSAQGALDVYVMGTPKGGSEDKAGRLGPCPYSLQVLLALEEKGIPYTPHFVDLGAKPGWLVDAGGKVPVVRDGGRLVADSAAICDHLEAKFQGQDAGGGPRRRLGSAADAAVPSAGALAKALAYCGSGSPADRAALLEELRPAEAALSDARPFLGGAAPDAADCALAPRPCIARAARRELRGWDWAREHPQLLKYLFRWAGRRSWRNAASWSDESVAADVRRKLGTAASGEAEE